MITFIFATFLDPTWYKTCLYLTEHIERSIQVPSFLVNGETLEDFSTENVDAGFVNVFSSARLQQQRPHSAELIAAPLFRGTQEEDIACSFFDIVVHKESALTSLEDLNGGVWAYHTTSPHIEDHTPSTHRIPGIHFRDAIEAVSQAQSLHLVLQGQADAAAIDSRKLDLLLRNCPDIAAQLRILGTYSHVQGPLVVVGAHIPAVFKKKIREVFLNAHRDTYCAYILEESQIERFLPITNGHPQQRYPWMTQEDARTRRAAVGNIVG